MENKNVKMIRDYMNLMESVEKNIISEAAILTALTKAFAIGTALLAFSIITTGITF